MRKIIAVSVIAILGAFPLFAQNVGDKVIVILKNGGELNGIIKEIGEDKIFFDFSVEYSSSVGLIGIEKSIIEKMQKVAEFTAEKEEKVSIEEIRARLEKENKEAFARREETRTEDAAKVAEGEKKLGEEKKKAEEGDVTKKVDEMTEWLALVKEFPPGEKWNEKKYLELKDQFNTIKVPLTFEEQRFVDNYENWKKGIEYKEKLIKSEQEKGTESQKKEEQKSTEEKKEQSGVYRYNYNPYEYPPSYTRTVAVILPYNGVQNLVYSWPCCYYTPCVTHTNTMVSGARHNNERNIRGNVGIRDVGFKHAFEPFAIPLFARNH